MTVMKARRRATPTTKRHPGPASLYGPLRAALRAGGGLRATTTTTDAHSTTTPKNSKDNNTQRPKPPTCARHGPAPSGMICEVLQVIDFVYPSRLLRD